MIKDTCEHGYKPWWDCDACRANSSLCFTRFSNGAALISEKPLVLGETLLPDGTVKI